VLNNNFFEIWRFSYLKMRFSTPVVHIDDLPIWTTARAVKGPLKAPQPRLQRQPRSPGVGWEATGGLGALGLRGVRDMAPKGGLFRGYLTVFLLFPPLSDLKRPGLGPDVPTSACARGRGAPIVPSWCL
jgi:hypothetical protein